MIYLLVTLLKLHWTRMRLKPGPSNNTDVGQYSECAFIDKSALLSLKFYSMRNINYSMLARSEYGP